MNCRIKSCMSYKEAYDEGYGTGILIGMSVDEETLLDRECYDATFMSLAITTKDELKEELGAPANGEALRRAFFEGEDNGIKKAWFLRAGERNTLFMMAELEHALTAVKDGVFEGHVCDVSAPAPPPFNYGRWISFDQDGNASLLERQKRTGSPRLITKQL